MRTTALGLGLAAVLLVGCQAEGEPAAGDEPATPRALAWLAAEHLGEPSGASAERDAAEEFGQGGIGTELDYGHQVVLAVGQDLPRRLLACGAAAVERVDGCEVTDAGTLMWELEEPEEDPGVLYVIVAKEDSEVLMFSSGPKLTGDPRDLDLPVSVDDLFDLAHDPRVDVTTTQEALEEGGDIDYWKGPDS